MSTPDTMKLACRNALQSLDRYMDNQLDPTAAAVVLRHVEACPACAQELELRRHLRNRLRAAVSNEAPNPYLGARVLANLRREQTTPPWIQRSGWLGAAAAALLLTFGVAIAYQLGHLRFTGASQDAFVESIIQRVSLTMRPGLMDHVHCGVFRKYPKDAPSPDSVAAHLAPEYRELVSLVSARAPSDFRVMMAHECGFRGRRFVHVVLRSDSRLMSLILTKKRPGEAFRDGDLPPVAREGGVNLYAASAQRFQIAAFESRDHLAYLVSDLPQGEHRQIMIALVAPVQNLLSRIEI